MKTSLIWINYLLRGALGRRRFVGVSPPSSKKQRIYDRATGRWLSFKIRDDDDWIQIEHIFLNDEFDSAKTGRKAELTRYYEHLISEGKTPLIVDLGANIGLASAYFHELWPKARIVSVEPDAGNCALARANLPATAALVEAAVASHGGMAGLIDTGRNCGFQVDADVTAGTIPLVTVDELLARFSGAPFIIKIDIEGFEENLFSANTEWIDKFPLLLIELHDWMLPGRCVTKNFIKALAVRERELMHLNGYVVSVDHSLLA